MKKPTAMQPSLATRVIELVENARRNVAAVANVAQVYTNYEIGRQIVEEEQGIGVGPMGIDERGVHIVVADG